MHHNAAERFFNCITLDFFNVTVKMSPLVTSWRSSTVEQLICNQPVAGSNPIASSRSIGGVPEWPKGADCKSAGDAFGGSNPPPSTILHDVRKKKRIAGIAQWLEHQPSKLRVAGSSPVSRSNKAHVAQSAEHFLGKEEVTGSIPVVGSRS